MATVAQWKDLGERAGWTLLQGGFGVGVVELLGLPVWVAVPLAGALAAVKASLAQKYGNGTGATISQRDEPKWDVTPGLGY